MLTDFDTLKTTAYLKKVHKCSREGTHPLIIDFYKALQKELQKRGYPFYAFYFYRSDALQARLKAQGVTKAGPGQSPHNHGCAVDVVHATRFWDLTRKEWAIIGAIGKEVARRRKIKLVWGGDWKFYDPAHWELENWREYRWAGAEHERLYGPPEKRDDIYFARLDQLIASKRKKAA